MFCLFAAPAFAQQTLTGTTINSIPDVVVSATGDPTPAANLGSSVTVITADQIAAQQNRTIVDVLNNVPGLNVVQSGGPGTQTSLFMWGTNSNHVKVLIDGIDVSDPTSSNGAFDFSQLLTGDIARVEVLRGPQSGLYGSDAIGGVISITTKAGSGPGKAAASVEAGSFGTFNQKLAASGSSSIFDYSFTVQHFLSDSTPVTPNYMLLPGEQANDNSYDNWTYSARVGATLSDTFAVHAVARYTDSTLLNTNYTNCPPPNYICYAEPLRSQSSERQFYTREEAVWHSLDNRYVTTLGVNYANIAATYSDPNSIPDAFISPSSSYSLGQRLTFDLKQEILIVPGQKLIVGALDQQDTANFGAGTDYTMSDQAVYGELESSFFNRLFVASNVRMDNYSSFGGHFTYRISPAYIVPGLETKLMASVGSGFKAPTLAELYQNIPDFGVYGNPNLLPEESFGYSVGFEQPLLNNQVRVGSTYFHNNITNLIENVFSADYYTYVNVGRALTYGDESFVSYTPNDKLNFRVDYTYTYAIDLDTDQQLLRRPMNKASFQANWTPIDKLQLSATVLYVGPWLDVNAQTFVDQTAKGYGTVNLAASYEINDHVSAFARVDNLFNRIYEDPLGFLHPGFGAYGGLRVAAF